MQGKSRFINDVADTNTGSGIRTEGPVTKGSTLVKAIDLNIGKSGIKVTRTETRDWTGNKNTPFSTLGASNHSMLDREQHDYYATDPAAVKALLEKENFAHRIWEPACGEGHISKVLESAGYDVKSTDLIYRGFGSPIPQDFLHDEIANFAGDIITNPPYRYATEFVEKALGIIGDGHIVAMLLKLTFLEGKKRKQLFAKYPPKKVYVFSERVVCALNGDFKNVGSSAVCYAWFVWGKGFTGKPEIDWI